MAGHAVRTADLHVEDDNGNNWALVTVNDFVPAQVSLVALVLAGPADGGVPSTVLRTELLETVDGRTVVLVTFRPDGGAGDVPAQAVVR